MGNINLIGFILMVYGAVMLFKIDHAKRAIVRWGSVLLVFLVLVLATIYLIGVSAIILVLMVPYWCGCTLFDYMYEYDTTYYKVRGAMYKGWKIYPDMIKLIKTTFNYTK